MGRAKTGGLLQNWEIGRPPPGLPRDRERTRQREPRDTADPRPGAAAPAASSGPRPPRPGRSARPRRGGPARRRARPPAPAALGPGRACSAPSPRSLLLVAAASSGWWRRGSRQVGAVARRCRWARRWRASSASARPPRRWATTSAPRGSWASAGRSCRWTCSPRWSCRASAGERAGWSPQLADAFLAADGRAGPHGGPAAVVDRQPRAPRGAGVLAGAVLALARAGVLRGRPVGAGSRSACGAGRAPGDRRAGGAHHRRHRADLPLPRLHRARAAHRAGHQRRGRAPAGHRGACSRRARTARCERAEIVVNGQALPLKVDGRARPRGQLRREAAAATTTSSSSRHAREGRRGGPGHRRSTWRRTRAPQVTLLTPAAELEVDPGQKVTLKYEATDDYGLTALELVFRTPGAQQETRVPLPREDGRRTRGTYTLGPRRRCKLDARRPHHLLRRGAGQRRGGRARRRASRRTQVLRVYSAAEHRRDALREGRGALGAGWWTTSRTGWRARTAPSEKDAQSVDRRADRGHQRPAARARTSRDAGARSCRASATRPRSSWTRCSTSPDELRRKRRRPPRTSGASTCAPSALRGEDWGTGTRLTARGGRRDRRDGEGRPLPRVAARPAEAGGRCRSWPRSSPTSAASWRASSSEYKARPRRRRAHSRSSQQIEQLQGSASAS